MTAPPFFDTNILLYSISGVAGEASKRERAIGLLDGVDGALSVQVLQEFYVQATRATNLDRLSHELALAFVSKWRRFHIQDMTLPVMDDALKITRRYGFSYWDSAIIAAARALGCREVFTEDMSDGQHVENVVIVNPFR